MKVFLSRFLLCATFIAIMVIVSACGNAAKPVTVAIFSAGDISRITSSPNTPQNTPQLEQSIPTPQVDLSLANEQKVGYQYAEDEFEITPVVQSVSEATPAPRVQVFLTMDYQLENNPQQEIAAIVRDQVVDKKYAVIAMLGATSNENSLRLASLPNAFEVPLIIPSSMGDNLLPSNNLWVFRLSAPGAYYAQYFFGRVLNLASFSVQSKGDGLGKGPTLTPTPTLTATPTPASTSSSSTPLAASTPQSSSVSPTQLPLKVAILYEEDTFGESAAVAAAREAMKQGMAIGFYGNFNPVNLDEKHLKEQVDEIKKQGVHLVYLISSQPDTAQTVVQIIRANIPKPELPVLLGQSGAFSSLKFLGYPEAEGMYVLRQKIFASCPKALKSLTEAQSYDAVMLLRSAIEKAKNNFGNAYDAQTLEQKRILVRNELQKTNEDLKCLGQVSFDNSTGQNQNLQFEILQIANGAAVSVDEKDFREALRSIYSRSTGTTNSTDEPSPFDITP